MVSDSIVVYDCNLIAVCDSFILQFHEWSCICHIEWKQILNQHEISFKINTNVSLFCKLKLTQCKL